MHVDIIREVGDGPVLHREELRHEVVVAPGLLVGHRLPEHVLEPGVLHLERRQELALQELLGRRPLLGVVGQQAVQQRHLPATLDFVKVFRELDGFLVGVLMHGENLNDLCSNVQISMQ